MNELQKPTGIENDDRAQEMIRFWLANNAPHVTLHLGMWEDAEDSDVDELFAWGNLLSDIAQHIANGFEQSHGWGFEESMKKLIDYFIECTNERAPGLEGYFPNETKN